jgi:predicted flavoprotein YhiN
LLEAKRSSRKQLGSVLGHLLPRRLAELDQQTMACKRVPGLHFIGEVVDITGWLGGYYFQWAWASAVACARSLVSGRLSA